MSYLCNNTQLKNYLKKVHVFTKANHKTQDLNSRPQLHLVLNNIFRSFGQHTARIHLTKRVHVAQSLWCDNYSLGCQ